MIFYHLFWLLNSSHLSRRQFASHAVHLFGILPLWASLSLIPCFKLLQDITLSNKDSECDRRASLWPQVSNSVLGDHGFWLRRGHGRQRETQWSNRTTVGCPVQTCKRSQCCPPGRSTDVFILSSTEQEAFCTLALEVE